MGRFRAPAGPGHSKGRSEVIEHEPSGPQGHPASDRACKVYLVGFMGAGKTAVGSCLAKLMNREFVDLDRTVEGEAKIAIADIFSERGEEAFRSLETAALGSVAGREQDLVVATGGGTATRAANVELMRSTGTSVWLDAPFEEILNRLDGIGRTRRPLFGSVAEARRLYEARREAYAAADLRIDVAADANPEETAERLQRILSAGEPTHRFQTGRK